MSLLVRTSLIMLVAVAFVSCGGSSSDTPDEDAIQDVFSSFFKAFEDEDADKLAGLLSDDCDDPEQRATEAIESYAESAGGQDAKYDVTDVDFRDLTATTASARPLGTIRTGDGEFPIEDEDAEYASLEKVDDEWKLTDCNILF